METGMIMIKDAAKTLSVESHVLRYWEEELGLTIKRNSMGHRYYDDRDIKMFQEVKCLRDKGFSLKDIKEGIERQREKLVEEQKQAEEREQSEKSDAETENMKEKAPLEDAKKVLGEIPVKKVVIDSEQPLKVVDFKTAQLQALMNKIVANALRENKDIITSSIKSELTSDVMRQFDTVMREKEEKEEERYRKLDETLRLLQRSNDEVAATRVKRGIFSRKKK